jgi:hypothetical protein
MNATRLIKTDQDTEDPALWLSLSLQRAKRFAKKHWDMKPKEPLSATVIKKNKKQKHELGHKQVVSAEQLEKEAHGAQGFLKERWRINKEIKELSTQIRAYLQINRRFGGSSLIDVKIIELREAKTKLLDDKKEMARKFPHLKQALDVRHAENEWTKRWKKSSGPMTERTWIVTHKGRTFEIDKHGLMIDRFYEILPDNIIILQLMKEAQKRWGVPMNRWISISIPTGERIEKLSRKIGKKTGSGARVAARKEHARFADEVTTLMAGLTSQADIYVDDIEQNPILKDLYDKTIRPKIMPPEDDDTNQQEEESTFNDLH